MPARTTTTDLHGAPAAKGCKPRRGGRPPGFTLVELAAGLAVAAILAAAAYPSFVDTLRHARRADAHAALAALQQAQERWLAGHGRYAASLPGVAALSARGHYALAVDASGPGGYVATATAIGSQAADADCALIGVRLHEGRLQQGSGAAGIDWDAADPDGGRCWPR